MWRLWLYNMYKVLKDMQCDQICNSSDYASIICIRLWHKELLFKINFCYLGTPTLWITWSGIFVNLLLTHWGRVTHICVGNLTIIGSDNGLSPDRRQAITWTNVGILLIGPLGTNFSEILIEIHTFSFKKIHLKMSFGKWRPFCLSLNVLMTSQMIYALYPAQI